MPSTKHKNRLQRIIPFGVIWLVFGVVYSLVVKGILADSTVYPATGIPYHFVPSLIITSLAALPMGLLLGVLEVYLFDRLFRMRYFWVRIALKALSYTSAIVIFLLCLNAVYLSSVLHHPLFSSAILVKSTDSLRASWFWSIIAYIGTIATMSLLLAEIQQYMGYGVLRNFFTGRYHEPVQEERIFMFVDMKSSTTLAEEMGHVRYFALLNRYYAVISSAIADTNGVILQYVGDEIVITWTLDSGVRDQDCLHCFFHMKDALSGESAAFMRDFGRVPGFKAGLHSGAVTTGEVGTLRKEIIFTGDVLNTTARIQGLCNDVGVDLLVSGALLAHMGPLPGYTVREIGARELKGKNQKVDLFTVSR